MNTFRIKSLGNLNLREELRSVQFQSAGILKIKPNSKFEIDKYCIRFY